MFVQVVMPYVSTVPEKLKEPCKGCARPYGFRNAHPLSPDASKFVEEVRKAPVSGNLDAPEGGFDAIMQVNYVYYVINFIISFIDLN